MDINLRARGIKNIALLILVSACYLSNGFSQGFDPTYPKFSPSELGEDLNYIFRKYSEVHPSFYNETPKDTVLKRLDLLKKSITKPLNRIEFMNLFSPVLYESVRDGHNYALGPDEEFNNYLEKGGLLFPIPVIMENRRLYCNSNKAELPLATEILSINGIPAKLIIDKILSGYYAESDAFEEATNSQWFSGSFWYSFGNYQTYEVEYFDPNGSKKSLTLNGRTPKQIDGLRITKQGSNYSFHELPDLKAGLINYNLCEGLDKFRPFCEKVFATMQREGYKDLIIDIRANPGGTTRLNEMLYEYLIDKPIKQFERIETKISKEKKREFIASNRHYSGNFKWYNYLYYPIYIRADKERKRILTAPNGSTLVKVFQPERPKSTPLLFNGNVYLLTGKRTYSAAAILAATFKAYKIGTIIGEETGEPTTFFANTTEVILPNTKLKCSISCAKIVVVGSGEDGRGVMPDITVSDTSQMPDQILNMAKIMIKKSQME